MNKTEDSKMKRSTSNQEGYIKRPCKTTMSVLTPKIKENTDGNVESSGKVEMIWIPWSEKSNDVSFKSTVTGVGDGEQKMSRELDTPIFGQNSPYDMMPILNGIKTKCDIKKLDAQDDFNTGKEGRDALRHLKTLHAILLDSIGVFAKSDIFTSDEKEQLTWFNDVSPDELAVGTLKKLNQLCSMLSLKKKCLRSSLPIIPFTAHFESKEMPLDLFYNVCQKLNITFSSEFSPYMETIRVLEKMDHIYIDHPDKLMEDLQALVDKIFRDMKIILVHQEKGYMILPDTSMIHFYRITRGHPRFKVIF